MASHSTTGQAVRVVGCTDRGAIRVYKKALESILLAEEVKNLRVVVITIAGAFRTGKSFLLNFCLRFLLNGCKTDGLGDPNAPLDGFSWSRGSDPDTKGIMMWNEAIQVTTLSGKKVAVVLMDTQGAFDGTTETEEAVAFFDVAATLSSVLIYNISGNIQIDHLDNLNFFASYAKLAAKEVCGKPFQQLMFLVRNWDAPTDKPYGTTGGRILLQQRLYEKAGKPEKVQELQEQICSAFESIDCFLMPHPGNQMAKKKDFRGCLADLDNDFKEELRSFIHLLLAPSNLAVKKTNGKDTTCEELMMIFQEYEKTLSDGQIPTHMSLLEANARQQQEKAVQDALTYYKGAMKQAFDADSGRVHKCHEESLKTALQMFDTTPKLGNARLAKEYRNKLSEEATKIYKGYVLIIQKNGYFTSMKNERTLSHVMTGMTGAAVAATVVFPPLAPLILPFLGGAIGAGAVADQEEKTYNDFCKKLDSEHPEHAGK